MEIDCELKEVKEGEIESIPGGVYLSIKTNYANSSPILILFKEFEKLYAKSMQISAAVSMELGIAQESNQIDTSIEKTPDFNEIINFLIEKINIDKKFFTDENNEIIIKSDIVKFLELPWENMIEDNLFIIRKIIPKKESTNVNIDNNLLLIMSHAYEGVGKDIKKVMSEEIKSIYEALHFFVEDNQNYFRINNILLSKHTTVEAISKIPWQNYNFAHLVMHGDKNGNLCLENSDISKYKLVDPYSSDKFLELIKDHCLKLVFLSMCYSGGGLLGSEENLAFKIIKSGCSKNVIAYSDSVGEKSAQSFVDIFYKNLATPNHDNIKDIYKKSLATYYLLGKKKYIPFLYSSI